MNILTPQQWGVFHSYQQTMTQSTDNTPSSERQTIGDLDTFFHLLTTWHESKVAMLNHMMAVPDGTEVTPVGEETPTITLTGDTLAGFQLGIELSLLELGTLPFYEGSPADESVSDEPVTA